jgi:MSHA biogenesis protein MshJ
MKLDRDSLNRQWAHATRAFDHRPQRERVLLISAAAVLVLWLLSQSWLDSQWQHWSGLRQQRLAASTALQTLRDTSEQQISLQQIRQQQAQTEIQALRQRLDTQATSPVGGASGLVGPQEMLPLLSRLLSHEQGLRVRTLRSLGQTPLSGNEPSPKPAQAGASATPAAAQAAVAGQPMLYRHAVELSVEGSYADLLSYLQALESMPQKLLWGSLQLKVEKYPQVLLTLRVYTLSQQAGWVEL